VEDDEVKVLDPDGNEIPLQPLESFTQCPFPAPLMNEIQTCGFTRPSQIQGYAWPVALQGHDVIGVAATGSGKTIAFLFPAFMHILNNRIPAKDPVLLCMSPTRELTMQIEKESQRFGSSSGIKTVCVYGGQPKGMQLSQMRAGCHCLIATPGRLNDFLEGRSINLSQVCKLVFDEADRMLDMGFEPQIRKVLKEVPSKRHTLFFTATWPKEVRRLAEDFLNRPYQVKIGNRDELKANQDITQIVKIVNQMDKNQALVQVLQEHRIGDENTAGLCIVFVATKRGCDDLERNLMRTLRCAAIHGDKDQRQRDEALKNFREGRIKALLATDVAARGLDIKGVTLVINFDPANHSEDYVHRIGRTGRAGTKGTAVTFLTERDATKGRGIIEVMEKTSQPVSQELRDFIEKNARAPKGEGKGMRFSEGGERTFRDRSRGRDRDRARGGDRGGGSAGMPSSNPFTREENKRSPSRSRSRKRSRSRRRRERSRSQRSRGDRGRRRGRSESQRSADDRKGTEERGLEGKQPNDTKGSAGDTPDAPEAASPKGPVAEECAAHGPPAADDEASAKKAGAEEAASPKKPAAEEGRSPRRRDASRRRGRSRSRDRDRRRRSRSRRSRGRRSRSRRSRSRRRRRSKSRRGQRDEKQVDGGTGGEPSENGGTDGASRGTAAANGTSAPAAGEAAPSQPVRKARSCFGPPVGLPGQVGGSPGQAS